jgi:diguanylate cyclase (GGDEF)-like protein
VVGPLVQADGLRIGVARDVTRQKRAEAIQIATYAVSEAAHRATDLDSLFEWIHAIIAGRVALAGLAVAIRDPAAENSTSPTSAASRAPYPRHPGPGPAPASWLTAPHHVASDALVQVAIGHDPGDASWLILPLVIRQETIGALALQAPVGARYDDADLELLHFVSAQVATAIEHGQLKAQLLRAAQYDELTNLPNRRLFHDRLDTALARSQRKRGRMALLYIDMDDFKHVNDTLGHAAGDVLLQHIARRLEACVRKADTVARLGGDEFVVILEEVHGATDADAVADKIRSVLREGITLGGRLLHTEASIGVAIYPDDGAHAEALLKHADGGMYREKMG